MKCWLIQKLLPLYVGGDDLPIFRASIAKHIEKCSTCRENYQKHLASQRSLRILKNLAPPENIFQGFWEEIQTTITPNHPKPIALWRRIAVPLASAALVLFAIVFFVLQFFSYDLNSRYIQGKNVGTFKKILSKYKKTKTNDPSQIEKAEKKSTQSIKYVPGPCLIPLNMDEQDYELNTAEPVKPKNTSF